MTPRTIFFIFLVVSSAFGGVLSEFQPGPSESECRPYIEKALQGAGPHETQEESGQTPIDQIDDPPESAETQDGHENQEERGDSLENAGVPAGESVEETIDDTRTETETENEVGKEQSSVEDVETSIEGEVTSLENEVVNDAPVESTEKAEESNEKSQEVQDGSTDENVETKEEQEVKSLEEVKDENLKTETAEETTESGEEKPSTEGSAEKGESLETENVISEGESLDKEGQSKETTDKDSQQEEKTEEAIVSDETAPATAESIEETKETTEEVPQESVEQSNEVGVEEESVEEKSTEEKSTEEKSVDEKSTEEKPAEEKSLEASEEPLGEQKEEASSVSLETPEQESPKETITDEVIVKEDSIEEAPSDQPAEPILDDSAQPTPTTDEALSEKNETSTAQEEPEAQGETEGEKSAVVESPEEELIMDIEIPKNLRSREHMAQILQLDIDTAETEKGLTKIAENTLKELKKLYDVAIKPLEILYKYRDLSNRHFGDPEIFSKPLILFMGPWSGGKSTIINYLLENEYKRTALRTGAEPSPAYFNIVMWGEQEEVLDGTQLAADWTFSGLQKFGQGLLDRLRGLKMNHPLLEKVNIVEIPGILEIRKQVERLFPFNDACQWFIDRADIIFLVYDPSKLDVGPESEAILDQLKGREMQTRIILNKADQVRPEELMRVQGTLIWNISPLMSSTEPPVMYSTSLWSLPYESGAPTRLLYAQERAFLRDLREAITKRVENKIASARRFAVRVRNHAKMVDCYLTTYYNHKSFFGNKKKVSDDIIEHPQNYHIYEGLSTLTNISRYDLPDPDVYKDFFRLNPVYEFQQLAATCTYFRGCPINRLDIAIAYDLPELIGKYKKHVEEINKGNK